MILGELKRGDMVFAPVGTYAGDEEVVKTHDASEVEEAARFLGLKS